MTRPITKGGHASGTSVGDSRFRDSADAHHSSVFQMAPRKGGLPRAPCQHARRAERGAPFQCACPVLPPALLYRMYSLSYGISSAVPRPTGQTLAKTTKPKARAKIVSELYQKTDVVPTRKRATSSFVHPASPSHPVVSESFARPTFFFRP